MANRALPPSGDRLPSGLRGIIVPAVTNSRSFGLSLDLPEGFRGERLDAGWVASRTGERQALVDAGFFDPERIESIGEPTSMGGRGSLRRLSLPSGPVLLRPYLHGGLLRFVTGKRFFDRARPFRELCLAADFRASGLPAPEPIAAAAFGGSFGYRLYYLAREIPGVDLFAFLGSEKDSERRRRILHATGEALRGLHDVGWVHADLHPKNLLLEEGTQRIHFLDLDRSWRQVPLPYDARMRNLARLFRYGERRRALSGEGGWKEEDFLALLHGYEKESPQKLAVEIAERFGRVSMLHKLGWLLEKMFSKSK